MGKPVSRIIFVIAIALSIGVAAPFHALAMAQPCVQMAAQMAKNGPIKALMEQAGEAMAEDVKGGEEDSKMAKGGVGALASMDCAQHCSDLGTASPVLRSLDQLADTPPASGTPPLIRVFLEPDPLPPKPRATA